MTPPKAADMAGWGEPAPEPKHVRPFYSWPDNGMLGLTTERRRIATGKPARVAEVILSGRGRRPSLLRRFMRRVWRRG